MTLVAFYRKSGMLRGSNGIKPNMGVFILDRLVRVAVLGLFFSPLLLVIPFKLLGLFVAFYLPTYLYPAELYGGLPLVGRRLGIRDWSVWRSVKERYETLD